MDKSWGRVKGLACHPDATDSNPGLMLECVLFTQDTAVPQKSRRTVGLEEGLYSPNFASTVKPSLLHFYCHVKVPITRPVSTTALEHTLYDSCYSACSIRPSGLLVSVQWHLVFAKYLVVYSSGWTNTFQEHDGRSKQFNSQNNKLHSSVLESRVWGCRTWTITNEGPRG